MKSVRYIVLLFGMICGLSSCQKDEDMTMAIMRVQNEQIEPSYTSADIECFVECNVRFDKVVVECALTEDFNDPIATIMTNEEGLYRAQCKDLLDDTTYYVRYIISNRISSMAYDEISTFRTLAPSIPIVHLDSVVNIWDIRADAFAHIEFDGGAPLSEWGIGLWFEGIDDTIRIISDSLNQCVIYLKDLQPNTSYEARAYATNKVGTAYSEQEVTFTTFALPEVQTYDITDVQLTTAILSGELLFDGNDTTTVKGFCFGEEQEPTIEDAHIQIDTISSEFSYCLSNLKEETEYQVRAYAKNKIGMAYGDVVSFTTKAAIPPIVVTTPATEVDYHSATVGGSVTSDGGAEIIERGICYSVMGSPTIDSAKIISGKGTGNYTVNLADLQDGATYYVRAYAINRKGIAYGEQVAFMTKGYKLPTITTATPTNISFTSATIGGDVTSDGGAEVTERGICYSTTSNPTISDSKVSSGSGTGSFICNLTNLQPNTTYYIRAYAINKKGTNYGEQKSLTTLLCHYFSISSTKKIVFSPGNLQYHPANDEWRFAEKQYDYIGEDNENISSTYNGWLDLFGWGTGDAPTKSSTEDDDYETYVDWGINQIGADTPNTWRTLSQDEWMYIFCNRPNAQSLFALGSINGVNGIIILPDYWTTPAGVSFVASTTQGFYWNTSYKQYYSPKANNFSDNTYTSEHWSKMEQAGAVFLPASGFREGTDMPPYGSSGSYDYGLYWLSSKTHLEVYILRFGSYYLYPMDAVEHYYDLSTGLAVRLAQDFNIASLPCRAGK